MHRRATYPRRTTVVMHPLPSGLATMKVARRKWRRHKAHGRHTTVRLDLGAKGHHNVWVRFLERIKVRSRAETIRFARFITAAEAAAERD